MSRTARSDLLFESGVLTVTGENGSLTDSFESAVDEYARTVAGCSREEITRLVAARTDGDLIVDALVGLGEVDPRSVAEFCALYDELDEPTDTDWLSMLPILRLFRPESIPADGAPEQAVPVPAEHLPFLARIYSPALTYVWLDDCPPCDSLKVRLESTFESPQGMLLFAVYGPDNREFLAREYGVTAGPALLFMRNGSVDARLYGDHGDGVLETELERLRR